MSIFESHAQNLEDVVLWRALSHVDRGTYVDVGAADPDEDSVTKAFYERGWSGLNVEPADDYAERLREARPRDLTVQVCAGESAGTVTFHHVLGSGLSSVVESSIDALPASHYEVVDVEVPMQRLDALLVEAGFDGREIHFLKIDVEGFEKSVLRGIDLSLWRPWVIVAEATAPNSPEQVHHHWEPLLLEGGYEFCLFDGLNRFYVAAEHPELRANLSYPASVFDQPFSTPSHSKLLHEYDRLLQGYEERGALYENAIRSYESVNTELERSLDSYQRLHALYDACIDSYSRLELEYQKALENYERIRSEHDSALSALGQLQNDHRSLANERDEIRRELELTLRTLSWRVTRPLRAVRRRVDR